MLKCFSDTLPNVSEPIKINEHQIKQYLAQFKEQNTQRAHCKRSRKLPIVLSVDEVQSLFNACPNLKHKAIMALMYSTGLRVSEVVNLQIKDIDSQRMVINIRNAKGGKDRQVMLNQNLLHVLREYFKRYHPSEYLFNGQDEPQYSARSIANFLKRYSAVAGLHKRVYPHLLRHCSFTHLVEAGTDINLVQRLAGHQSVRTTNLYIQTSHTFLSKIQSPLAQIRL